MLEKRRRIMSNAKKCDRCARYYDKYNEKNDSEKINALIPANVDTRGKYWSHETIELCPECMKEFKKWISRGKKTWGI